MSAAGTRKVARQTAGSRPKRASGSDSKRRCSSPRRSPSPGRSGWRRPRSVERPRTRTSPASEPDGSHSTASTARPSRAGTDDDGSRRRIVSDDPAAPQVRPRTHRSQVRADEAERSVAAVALPRRQHDARDRNSSPPASTPFGAIAAPYFRAGTTSRPSRPPCRGACRPWSEPTLGAARAGAGPCATAATTAR